MNKMKLQIHNILELWWKAQTRIADSKAAKKKKRVVIIES